MKIYLCRHSKTEWNEQHKLQGWLDSPLTIQGKEDALKLYERIKNIPITCCYSSPIGRAKQTAQILFQEEKIIYDDRLKEMNFGDYEGMYVDELLDNPLYYQLWNEPDVDVRLPNGETYQEVVNRFQSFLDETYNKHQDDTIFLTIHGMAIIILRGIMEKREIKDFKEINQVFRGCSLSEVDYDGNEFKIHYLNDSTHLPVDLTQKNYSK